MVKQALYSLFASLALVTTSAAFADGNATRQRYPVAAYPGFDGGEDSLSQEKKAKRWFAFINGPERASAAAQFEYCLELEAAANWSKAVKEYDALVREWPTAPEAPRAQLAEARLLAEKIDDPSEAFAQYCYLVDYYSFSCDFDAIVDKMYALAMKMREVGKTVVFFHLDNSLEVRRSLEACVLRAPGAKWVPAALLTIGELRVEGGDLEDAVKVYENLRNLHGTSPEASVSLLRESEVRMKLLREHGYNRERCRDTIGFLRQATKVCRNQDAEAISAFLQEAVSMIEEEAYAAAKFYDSRMRTRRSAINAYEHFLADYPESVHAAEIQARINELKSGTQSPASENQP